MGKKLCEAEPSLRNLYDEASGILGYDVASLCFEGPADQLNQTEYTQPALLVTSIAALRLLESAKVQPSAVAGHSLGEYSALVAAKGFSFLSAVGLVQRRAQYMAQAVQPGSGLVVAVLGLAHERVEKACLEAQSVGVVSAANFNSPGQVVIAGEKASVKRAIELLKEQGCRRVIPLPVSVPVHTSLMQSAADQLASDLREVPLNDLQVPLVSNVDAQPLQKAGDIRTSMVQQLASPVLWEQSMRRMWEMGITTFIEIGPGVVLTGLVKRILPEAVTLNVQDSISLESTLRQVKYTS